MLVIPVILNLSCKLLEVTLADGDNEIFKNATIVWSKDLSNFWRSL